MLGEAWKTFIVALGVNEIKSTALVFQTCSPKQHRQLAFKKNKQTNKKIDP